MSNRASLSIFACFLGLFFVVASGATTTTFEKGSDSYYGRQSQFGKFAATVVPTPNDINSISSSAASDDVLFAELQRVTISAAGTDTDFTVTVKDDIGISLFSKADCNTVTLPLTYALTTTDAAGNVHLGVPVAGPITVDTNDVDPNNLTSVTVTIYYYEPRY